MSAFDALGFVPIEEVNNVRVTKLRELEEKLLPHCPTIERRADHAFIMDFFEGIFLEMQKRARGNVEDYIKRNPQVKKEQRDARKAESTQRTMMSAEDRVKLGRAIALGQQG